MFAKTCKSCFSNFSSGVFHVTFIEGKQHDAGMLAESHLLEELEANAFSLDGNPMCIYGDSAYPQRVHLQVPFQNATLTPMSSVQAAIWRCN